jgi:hypothetical protein
LATAPDREPAGVLLLAIILIWAGVSLVASLGLGAFVRFGRRPGGFVS